MYLYSPVLPPGLFPCLSPLYLEKEWKAGQESANQLLIENFGPAAQVDFETLFAHPDVDILRPLGSYIGSRVEIGDDRSEQELEPETPETSEEDINFDEPADMEIEDFLDDEENSASKPDPYLTIGGEKYHKSSVVTARLTSKGARKATM
jgi:hypothetical protein